MVARLSDGFTIEEHYQLDEGKGYRKYSNDWRFGKGKPPLDPSVDLYGVYKQLWRQWVLENPELFEELRQLAIANNYLLSDRFATTPVSQARALAELLNETA
ncbi:hypothetical protein D3C85_888920 [compost metagenome]